MSFELQNSFLLILATIIGIISTISSILLTKKLSIPSTIVEKESVERLYHLVSKENLLRKKLEESQQRYQSLFTHNPNGVYSLDKEGRLTSVNHALFEMLGYSKADLSKMTFHDVIDEDYKEVTNQYFQRAFRGEPQFYEIVLVNKSRKRLHVKITNVPIELGDKVIGVYGIATDVTKEKEATRLLEEKEEKYRSLFEHNLDSVLELDERGNFIDANIKAKSVTGFTKDELRAKSFLSLVADDLEKVIERSVEVFGGKAIRVEQKIINKYGAPIFMDISTIPIKIRGELKGSFLIARDITEKKRHQRRIRDLAYTDQLTGVPNRHWFYKELKSLIEKSGDKNQNFAVLTIDFDDFKAINDTLGHNAGDFFLKLVTSRMRESLRMNDKIARIGGDEFIIILENVTKEETRYIAEHILEKMNQPIILHDHEITVTLSIGISLFTSKCASDIETIIKQADLALYSAKEKGKNNYQFFSEELDEKISRIHQLRYALQKALDQDEFSLVYQPKIAIQTGKLVGFEALLRWKTDFGNVSPVEFIPIAEEMGLIIPIGEWVIREACRQMKKWESIGLSNVIICVNASGRQFKEADFALNVKKIIEEEGINPNYFEIEITESVMLHIKDAAVIINELKKLGVKIAIDDFGAGYSSLNVIREVEIDSLKIDKSLLENVMRNQRMKSILAAIISVGKSINAQVVIEGIETQIEKDYLTRFDVIGQGYFFSHPLPPEEIEKTWKEKWLK